MSNRLQSTQIQKSNEFPHRALQEAAPDWRKANLTSNVYSTGFCFFFPWKEMEGQISTMEDFGLIPQQASPPSNPLLKNTEKQCSSSPTAKLLAYEETNWSGYSVGGKASGTRARFTQKRVLGNSLPRIKAVADGGISHFREEWRLAAKTAALWIFCEMAKTWFTYAV